MTKALEIDRPWQKHKMCNILKTYIHTHFFVFDCLQLSRNFVVCLNFQVSFLSKNTQFSTQFEDVLNKLRNVLMSNLFVIISFQFPHFSPFFTWGFSLQLLLTPNFWYVLYLQNIAPGTGLGINECGTQFWTLDVVEHALKLLVWTAVISYRIQLSKWWQLSSILKFRIIHCFALSFLLEHLVSIFYVNYNVFLSSVFSHGIKAYNLGLCCQRLFPNSGDFDQGVERSQVISCNSAKTRCLF